MKKVYKKSKIILLLSLVMLPILFIATLFTTKIKAANLVTLSESEIVDRSYFAAGDFLDIKGTINGDAFLAGKNINFSGNVNGNLFVGGDNIKLSGKVEGNIFVGGNSITISTSGTDSIFTSGNLINISATTNRNLYVVGNSIITSDSANIKQDLFVGGSSIILNGSIGRDASISSASTTLNGSIGRDAKFDSGIIYVNQNAKIGKDVSISESTKVIGNLSQIKGGSISISKPLHNDTRNDFIKSFKSKVFEKLTIGLFSILIFGIILIKYLNKVVIRINKDIELNFAKNISKGVKYIITIPVIAIVLLITLIGVKVSVILMVAYALTLFFSSVFVSIFVGYFFITKILKHKSASLYFSLLIGALVFIIITIIPFVGWLFSIIMIATTIGALSNMKTDVMKYLNRVK